MLNRKVLVAIFGILLLCQWSTADDHQSFPMRPQHAKTELALANIFSDHMVLQKEKPLRIWGWATPGSPISVQFADQSIKAVADSDGNWSVVLAPLRSSFDARQLVVSNGKTTKTIVDVLVGEVWLCGGQSNMEMKMGASRDADMELLSADYPAIRFNRLPLVSKLQPQADYPIDRNDQKSPGHWLPCTAENVAACSGVGYYFARRLQRVLKTPIGIIDSSWGGTMAQHWVTTETLETFPQVTPYFEKHKKAYQSWLESGGHKGAEDRFDRDMLSWKVASEKFKSEQASAPAAATVRRPPRQPNMNAYLDPSLVARQPGGMMNGIIAPIAGLSIRGVLFYQGENNCFGDWAPFPKTFPAVIADWRRSFEDSELPFCIIQISGWSTRRSMTYDMNHPTNIIREIQFNTWRQTSHTGLVVTFDTNSSRGIHPAAKQPVGQRSARWALADVYHQQDPRRQKPLEWRGPIYESMEVKDGKCIVTFETDSARGLVLDQDVEVGFYIAGEDRVFHHASVRVNPSTKTATVWSDDVPAPFAVRYAWSNLPAGGLVNARELPAYPFRTDTWPIQSHADEVAYDIEKEN